MMSPEVATGSALFVTGAPGVGKSSVAAAYAARRARCFRIDLDKFRQGMVSGLVEPSMGWSDETQLQFELAHVAAGRVARTYVEAGIDFVIEHCSNPDFVDLFIRECPTARTLCLTCDLDTNLHRNETRTNKSFEPRDIAHFVHSLNPWLPDLCAARGMTVLDTTTLTIQETVDLVERLP